MNRHMEGLLNEWSDALLVLAPEGRIRFANANAQRLFGQHSGELLGEPALLHVRESVSRGYAPARR